jgi:hypothetical protein
MHGHGRGHGHGHATLHANLLLFTSTQMAAVVFIHFVCCYSRLLQQINQLHD